MLGLWEEGAKAYAGCLPKYQVSHEASQLKYHRASSLYVHQLPQLRRCTLAAIACCRRHGRGRRLPRRKRAPPLWKVHPQLYFHLTCSLALLLQLYIYSIPSNYHCGACHSLIQVFGILFIACRSFGAPLPPLDAALRLHPLTQRADCPRVQFD